MCLPPSAHVQNWIPAACSRGQADSRRSEAVLCSGAGALGHISDDLLQKCSEGASYEGNNTSDLNQSNC